MDGISYKKWMERAAGLFLSALIAVLLTMLFLAVFAFAMLKGNLSASVEKIGLIVMSVMACFVGGFLCYLVIILSDGQRTVFADFEQQYLFFLAGVGIYIYEHLSAVRRGAVKFIAIKFVCACGRHYGKGGISNCKL